MTMHSSDERSLLHLAANDILMQFGIPDVNYPSIMVYFNHERYMLLFYELELRDGLMKKTVHGYVCGTKSEGAMFGEGIRLFDGKNLEHVISSRMNLTQLRQEYTIADIGCGVSRPVMIGTRLSLWFIETDSQGRILSMREKKLGEQPNDMVNPDEIYRQILNM